MRCQIRLRVRLKPGRIPKLLEIFEENVDCHEAAEQQQLSLWI